MGNKNFYPLMLFVIPSVIIMSGCWDSIELDKRAFLAGAAMDLVGDDGKYQLLRITDQLVVPAGLGSPSDSGGGGGGKAFRNLSQEGRSIIEIYNRIQNQANRKIDLDHLEVIIISTDIAEKEGLIDEVLDSYVRYQYTRRGVLLAVADGKASNFLTVETEHEKVPAIYIRELMENDVVSVSIGPVRLGDIQEKMLTDRSFIIPHLRVYEDNSVDYEGLALFRGKTKQMVGSVMEEEARGISYILGKNQQGSIDTMVDEEMVFFNILEKGESSFKLTNKDKDNLQFDLQITLQAQIAEYLGKLDIYDPENTNKFHQALEKKLKEITENTIKKVKDDFQVDVFEIDNFLRMNHYELWQEIKDEWDYGENYFAKSDINVEVNATIFEPGSSLRIKKKED